MATGDSADFLARLKRVLPARWFATSAPIRDAVLGGLADALAFSYSLYVYVKAQTRIATATGVNLDLIAFDYFGTRFKRRLSQTDASFSTAIRKEIVRPRGTRPGLSQALTDLTGTPPIILEPFNAQDTGGWGTGGFALDAAGSWGDATPYDVFLTVTEPAGAGIPFMAGLDSPQGGWGAGAFALADLSLVTGLVTNADIYATVEQTRAAGVTTWVNIVASIPNPGALDRNFYLDTTPLG